MKKKKFATEYYVAIAVLVVSATIFSILTILEFAGGKIKYGGHPRLLGDLYSKSNKTKFEQFAIKVDFLFENSGFGLIHHVDNFLFCLLFSSAIVNIPYYIFKVMLKIDESDFNKKSIRCAFWIYVYFVMIIAQLAFATIWEYWERFIILVFEIILIFLPKLEFMRPYVTGGEGFSNTIHSDLPQGVLAPLQATLFIWFEVIKPMSFYLYDRSFWGLVLRFLLYAFCGLSAIMTHMKKIYVEDGFLFNYGFYMHFFARIFMLTLMYIDDIRNIKKRNMYEKERRHVNRFWIFIFIYLSILYIGSFDLRIPGFLVSNGLTVLYFCFCISMILIFK